MQNAEKTLTKKSSSGVADGAGAVRISGLHALVK